jgi:MoxR-like ATPase
MMPNTVLEKLDVVLEAMGRVIVGQRDPLEKMLIAMLCNGHVLLEGVPGIAKTMMVNTLAQALSARFSRIQFTPDLLPGDLVGTQIYRHETGAFETHRGPIFANVVLADEINRSPAKVQSALLEAMQERQVTLGGQTHKLPEPFMVLATQNPIEQEGTYSLPEAQVDRFMFKLLIEYPTHAEEHEILRRVARTNPVTSVAPVATLDDILAMRRRSTPSIWTRRSNCTFCVWWPRPAIPPRAGWMIWRRSSGSGPRPGPASISRSRPAATR